MSSATLSHRERLRACLAGEAPDRPPVALWRHFPSDDMSPQGLAAATLEFQRRYDFDLVKVTPPSSFCLADWGVRDEWRGASEGTRDYVTRAIHEPADWGRLQVLEPQHGRLGQQIECLRMLSKEIDPHTPLVQTIFSPLAQAKNLVGGANLLVHLRRWPAEVHAGLAVIAESTRLFIQAAIETGIAGIFYAVQHAQLGLLTPGEFGEFGSAYDLDVLDAAQDLWLNMVHLHGENVMFDQVAAYPVQALNWHDQDTPPGLNEGQQRFAGVVCGGLQRERTMLLGSPDDVRAEARRALEATGGRRFILGTGCVLPTHTPTGNIHAARRAVEQASA